MLSFESLFHDISRDYASLWDFKLRGATLEIITPHSTISSKFVSVFLTERNHEFIISDGGYLQTGDYVENEDIQQSRCYTSSFNNLESYYKIKRAYDSDKKVFFYLKTPDRKIVSSLVHNMASFITGVVNAQQMTMVSDLEAVARVRFTKKANSFIADAFVGRHVQFSQQLRPNDSIHFSAGIWRGANVNLIQFITGSDSYNFINSLAKATVNFLAVKGSSLESKVENKISLVDSNASGYLSGGYSSYAKLLGDTSNIIEWEQRNELVAIVEGISNDTEDLGISVFS